MSLFLANSGAIKPADAGGGGFSPTDIASLWAYFEADSYAGTHAHNDPIAAAQNWTDKSGNGRHGVRNGGVNTVFFRTNQVNGQPAVDMIGVNGYFSFPSMAALTEGSFYQVTRVKSVNAGGDGFGQGGGADHYPYTGIQIYDGWGSNLRRGPLNSLVPLSNWHLWHGWSKTNDWAVKQNNANLSTSGSNTVAFRATPLLGWNGTQYRNAMIAALYLFSTKLGPTDDAAMLSYIAAIYGAF